MRQFLIKPVASLNEQDFVEHSVWACYYEPDDIETLAALGFDRREVQQTLEAIGYSDDYVFPLPSEAAEAPFNYLYCSVRATTRGGNNLVGYVTGPCVAVYFQGKLYTFNQNLQEWSMETAQELAAALGERAVFPMQLEVVATSTRKEADLGGHGVQ